MVGRGLVELPLSSDSIQVPLPKKRRTFSSGLWGPARGRENPPIVMAQVLCTPLVCLGCTPRGSCKRTLLRRVLRRFSNSKCFLEGFLEGACKGFQ